jgi:hypothetical protein
MTKYLLLILALVLFSQFTFGCASMGQMMGSNPAPTSKTHSLKMQRQINLG